MKNIILFIFCSFLFLQSIAQKSLLKSGPWAGNVELRTAEIWFETVSPVASAEIHLTELKPSASKKVFAINPQTLKDFYTYKVELTGLEINTEYKYDLFINGKKEPVNTNTLFKTKDLWQFRKPAPDFTFLAGSCSYFNQPEYDRPGEPYGKDSSIFETMAKFPANFNIWLGDNWYTREVDYLSKWGLNYRASVDRSKKVLQNLMANMPQYAIWDDHDFGPNDASKSYILKDESRKIFMNYWLNPSYGEDGKGIYTKVSFSDVDFFLTDNRYFRTDQDYADSLNGKLNDEKTYFGQQQMEWLKNSLLNSRATFKVIISGSQVLNYNTTYDCMVYYKKEFNELMDFLLTQKINGVIFLSGDRHHSEIIKKERPESYPLYDITVSPLTSRAGKAKGGEVENPLRVPGSLIEEQNFGNFSVSGEPKNRVFKVDFYDKKGKNLFSWSIKENDLKEK